MCWGVLWALIPDCRGSELLSWGDAPLVLPLLLLGLALSLFPLSSFFQGTSMAFRQEPDSSCVNIQLEINSASGGVTLPWCLLQHFVFVSLCTLLHSSRSESHV